MEVQFLSQPDIENPIMIAAWPGMGYLAKISADYLRRQLDASLFAEVEYYHNVLVYNKGLCELAPIRHRFYAAKNENLIICVGDSQPSTPEESLRLAECIVNVAEKYHVTRIYTMAAFPNEYFQKPKVYGIYSHECLRSQLEDSGVEILEEEGAVNGLNGVIIGIAKNKGIKGVCLMGDIKYANVPQHLSSKEVLETLIDILGIQIDTEHLEKRAKKIDASIKRRLDTFQEKKDFEKKEEKLGYIS